MHWVLASLGTLAPYLVPTPCRAYDVLLRWTVPPSQSVAGYRVYVGGASRVYGAPSDVGRRDGATIGGIVYYLLPSIPAGATRYVAVTAYNAAGLESDFSNEKGYGFTAVTPPTANPGPNRTASVGEVVVLGATSDAGVSYYWEQIGGPTALLSSRTASSPRFIPTTVGTFEFALTAYDAGNVASRQQVTITVAGSSPPPVSELGAFALLANADVRGAAITLGRGSIVVGNTCGDRIRVQQTGWVSGDAIALDAAGAAIKLGSFAVIDGDAVTGGGALKLTTRSTVAGDTDTDGAAAALDTCRAARERADAMHADLVVLPGTPGMSLGLIAVDRQGQHILGPLGGGRVVVDASQLTVGRGGTLTIQGGAHTTQVIVRLAGRLRLRRNASIALSGGLQPEQLLFLVGGSVALDREARLAGTVMARGAVRLSTGATAEGQFLATESLRVLREATVSLRPFAGW